MQSEYIKKPKALTSGLEFFVSTIKAMATISDLNEIYAFQFGFARLTSKFVAFCCERDRVTEISASAIDSLKADHALPASEADTFLSRWISPRRQFCQPPGIRHVSRPASSALTSCAASHISFFSSLHHRRLARHLLRAELLTELCPTPTA